LYLANARVPSEKAHVYQIFQMVDAFACAGIDVEVAYPGRANVAGMEGQDPVALYGLRRRPRLRVLPSLDPVRLVTIDVPALNRPPLPAAAFAVQTATFALAAAWHARRSGAQVVYGRDWPVLVAAAAAGKPLVWEAHDLPQGGRARAVLRRVLPRLAAVVTISRGLRDDLLAWGVPAHKLLVAPDAVDVARFTDLPSRDDARRRLGLALDRRAVVYTGHLYRWKGAHTLALASRALPQDVDVYVVGGTPADVAAFRRFVADEALDRVRVAGHVPPADVPVWLAAADVLALPNSGRDVISSRYTSPLKLYEYLAAGRPIVASDLPSLRETLVDRENALLVPPDDPHKLAAGITAVLSDSALAQRLAQAGPPSVAGHTWDARARQIVAFVDERLGEAGKLVQA
jgi:glycosyltransferase involved in cell wall biosynthesis